MRLTLHRNGVSTEGRLLRVKLPLSMEEFLTEASEKLGLENSASKIYTKKGALVDDLSLLTDDEEVFLSCGEDFLPIVPLGVTPQLHGTFCGNPHQRFSREIDSSFGLTESGEEWLTLNVGGQYFTTTRSTLTQDRAGMLARMFVQDTSHGWRSSVDHNGAFLLDRSPMFFEPILNYLRHGQVVINKDVNVRGVLEEAKFFGVDGLIEDLNRLIELQEPKGDSTPISRREFVLRLISTPSKCELRCQGINFNGADLSKLDLRYINFKYAQLHGANLSAANLSYCNLERADLTGAKLDNANLLGAKMLCVNLEGASMLGCNLEDPAGCRTNLEGANLKQVNLEGSHMAGVNLRVANLKKANLQNCDLRGAVLAGADLENCDLSGCDLHEANLRGANLKGAAFDMMLNPLHMSQTVP